MTGNNLRLVTSLATDGKSVLSLDFLKEALRFWYLFAASLAVSFLIAFIFVRYATPVYEIHASLLVRDNARGPSFEDAALFESLSLAAISNSVDNEVEILRSRNLMESVVRTLHLQVRWFAAGRVKTSELYEKSPFKITFLKPILLSENTATYSLKLAANNKFCLSTASRPIRASFGDTILLDHGPAIISRTSYKYAPEDQYSIEIAEKDEVVRRYSAALKVTVPNKLASVVNLSLKDIIPGKGEAILHELIKQYLSSSIANKNRTADSTLSFITANLGQVSVELASIESEIAQFKRINGFADLNADSQILREKSARISEELESYSIKLELLEELGRYISNNPGHAIPTFLIQQETNFGILAAKFNELILAKERNSITTGSSHPEMQMLNSQLSNLRSDLQMALDMQKREVQIALASYNVTKTGLKSQISKVPLQERLYIDYSRQQQIKQELYLFLLKRKIETSIARSSTVANAIIVDTPKADPRAVRPNRHLVLLLSGCLGLFFPLGALHLRRILAECITSKSDIAQRCLVPIIGEVSYERLTSRGLFTLDTRGITAEQFRTLRTNILFASPSQKCQTILITSAASGEGKSFVAAHLAESFANAGRKVILLELDLRKPSLAAYLHLDHRGFADYMHKEETSQILIQRCEALSSFDIITSGPSPPHPAELFSTERFRQLIDLLKSKYDQIIIDTPPAGLVTDARIIGRVADMSLYVVRHDFTLLAHLDDINELLNDGQLPALKIIYNGARQKSGYQYYSHSVQKRRFF